jgi:NAD(P)-dependent dehydrogenase (short-subunit alcohol dehydrogenase family)
LNQLLQNVGSGATHAGDRQAAAAAGGPDEGVAMAGQAPVGGARRFEGQAVIITGAGEGVGRTMAAMFAAEGAAVAVAARTPAVVEAIAAEVAELGGGALGVPTDVVDEEAVDRLVAATVERFGRIDVLVNSAFPGSYRQPVLDMGPDDVARWRRAVDVGSFGTMLVSRAVAPHMIAGGGGAIVNVTAMSSMKGFAGRSDYAVGKSGAHLLAHVLADEWGPSGIRVNCVAPGLIWSPVLERWISDVAEAEGITYEEKLAEHVEAMALRRVATQEDVAHAVLFLASSHAAGITGATLDVNGGQLFN